LFGNFVYLFSLLPPPRGGRRRGGELLTQGRGLISYHFLNILNKYVYKIEKLFGIKLIATNFAIIFEKYIHINPLICLPTT